MMRSLFSGVSGLKNHQTRMDVIGNNISNVNTTGFKSSRVTFSDTLNQTLTGASSPKDNLGGTNPKQIGLGSAVSSIDLLFTDGSVQSTGKNTDLCLSGNGLFVVSNGSQTYYTRNGAFEFDAEGNYVIPGSGMYVQGWMGNDGVVNTTGAVGKITIAAGKSMKAESTSIATYANNLNANTTGYEISSILATYADGTSESLSSYPNGTMSLTLDTGDTITLDDTADYDFTTTDDIDGKKLYKTSILSATANGSDLGISLSPADSVYSISTITGGSGTDTDPYRTKSGFEYTVTTGTYAIGDKVTVKGTIEPAGVTTNGDKTVLTIKLSSPSSDLIQITCPTPNTFSYSDGDDVSFNLAIGQLDAGTGNIVNGSDGKQYDVCKYDLNSDSKLPIKESSQNYQVYGRGATNTPANGYPHGTIETISREEKNAESLSIITTDGQSFSGLPGENYNKGELFYNPVTTTVTLYDSEGTSHSIPILFTKTGSNTWAICLANGKDSYDFKEADGSTTTVTLSKTNLVFDSNGKYSSGSASINTKYSDDNGATDDQKVTLNLAGLTQFAGNSTINATSDGNAAGTLESVAIDASGVITGTYTNGVKQAEAQVAVAQFTNASGLTKTGSSLYQESNNSGTANIKTAADLGVKITPSALEMSNVDIANEFADMIVTQRGFQSNSKIITVGDEMLETVINMKR